MKIKKRKIISLAIGIGISLSVGAQTPNESAGTLNLSLKEAQDYAMQYNKTVQNSGLAVSQAQKKVWETISTGLPQVNASLDYTNMLGFKMSLFGTSIALEPTSSLQASISQLLFNGSYWVGIKMARIGEEVAETAKLQSELEIKQQVQSAYLSVLMAEENKKILEMNLDNIETLAKNVENMVRIGVAEMTDADQMKVQVGAIMNGIKSVERATELAYNLMRFFLGLSMETKIVLTETLDDLINKKPAAETLIANFDINANYNMQLLDKQVEIANKQINLEYASTLPTVALFYNYTYKIKASTFDMTPKNILGIKANIPIFASGQRHSRIQQAKINLESVQNNMELVSDQLLMQEKQLRFNLNNSIESLELQKEAMEVSQRVFESISRKFQHGTASSLDVTTASTNLLQTQTNYINAMMQVFTAQTELQKLLNTL
jgi:outer membrane protein TolC